MHVRTHYIYGLNKTENSGVYYDLLSLRQVLEWEDLVLYCNKGFPKEGIECIFILRGYRLPVGVG